jgi:sec-independent protein translocase protein TatA
MPGVLSSIACSPAFLGSSVGAGELFLIGIVVLVFFGPTKLPDLARTLGQWSERLRRAAQDFREQVMNLDSRSGSPDEPPPPTRGLPEGSGPGEGVKERAQDHDIAG